MNDGHEYPEPQGLGVDPADLDGHTIDELTDYLESGREPRVASIEESPGCQLALDALARLHGLGGALMAADTEAEGPVDDTWVDRIIGNIAMDARAGRRIPFASDDEAVELAITEGAVRGLIRGAEEVLPGLLVGRCRLDGDVSVPGAPVRVEVDASVLHGTPLRALADGLRTEVDDRLRRHTEMRIVAIDVVIKDIREVS